METEIDRMRCRLHNCLCKETEGCGCSACDEYRALVDAQAYMEVRRHEYAENRVRLKRIWDRLPESGWFVMDRPALYSFVAEEMLLELVETLGLPPTMIRLRAGRDFHEAPDVNLQVPSAWLADRTAIPENADKDEIKKLIDGYTRTIVAAACEKFMARWKKLATKWGYTVEEERRIVVPGRN